MSTSSKQHDGSTPPRDDSQTNEQMEKHTRWRVNTKLLPLKMFYCFFYGASGAIIPFITVYLKYLNLTASETGLITGLCMIFAMISRALIGILADKLQVWRTALVLCSLGFGLAISSLWFLPVRGVYSQFPSNGTGEIQNSSTLAQSIEQFYILLCTSPQGQELCRYPADLQHPICKIQHRASTSATSSSPKYLTMPARDDSANVTQVNDQFDTIYRINMSGAEADSNRQITRPSPSARESIDPVQVLIFENPDNDLPCLYIDTPLQTSNNIRHNQVSRIPQLKNSESTLSTHLSLLLNDTQRSYTRVDLENSNPSSQASNRVDVVFECLPNCSRQPAQWTSTKVLGDVQYRAVTPDFVFIMSFFLVATAKSFYAAGTSLADAVAYTILGSNPLKWGRQRLWGTIGTAAIVLSATIVSYKLQGNKFTMYFLACLLLTCLAGLVGIFKLRADKAPKNKRFYKDLGQVLSSGAVRLYLGQLLCLGYMCGTVQNFFFWFLVDLGGNQWTLAVYVLLYCTVSVLMLRFSSPVIKKLGRKLVMNVAFLAYTARFLVMSVLGSPWLALPVETLHCVTYSLFWAAASSTASIVAPVGTQATCQGVAGAIYWDLARGLGVMATGTLLELLGARWTFRIYSGTCLLALPLFWALDKKWPLQQQNQQANVEMRSENQAGEHLLQNLNAPLQDKMARKDQQTNDVCHALSRIYLPKMNGVCSLDSAKKQLGVGRLLVSLEDESKKSTHLRTDITRASDLKGS